MNERVVDFLYVLMRDHLPCGIVEELLMNHVEVRDHSSRNGDRKTALVPDDESSDFSNKGLEQYARLIAKRLHVDGSSR